MAISVGNKAPDFELVSKQGDDIKKVRLSDNFGKRNTVLLFFPAAFTGVCTEQLCDATAGLGDYEAGDADVWGISADTVFAQEAWAKASNIQIPLLSDYQKDVIRAYDVVLPDLVGHGPGSQRAAFVIDKEGIVRYSEQTPTPLEKPDSAKVIETLKSL